MSSSSSKIRVNPSTTSLYFSSQQSENNIFILEDIHSTITELQLNLMEHHRNELNLRTTMHAQSEQLLDLRTSLDVERSRNQRLAKLIRCVDSSSSERSSSLSEDSAGSMEWSRWRHSRPSIDAFESISPLLMQHRYHELSMSYKKCHRQLVKKDTKLRETQCEIEMLQAKYDSLMDEYKGTQKRVEQLCCKYLRLHANKNREIFKLKEALGCATQCIMNESNFDEIEKEVLRRNLQLFIRSLKSSIHEENTFE
ncbi:uncharacterized protein LOC129919881 [Episyrphus balteatus]|uniref:uncharacterized protein LOC129919881 n=1 Tax=Episyrphus balteatus TaxID=286459 RepID=UPI002486BD4C|nr:uncharacterized protein LOC129919881 [Episyrphus balteatus]